MSIDNPVGILTALREEMEPLEKRLERRNHVRLGQHHFFTGTLSGHPVVLSHSGDGPRNARSGADALLSRFRPSLLLGAGVAGGLSPGLEFGNVLVGRHLRDHVAELVPVLGPDAKWVARAVARGALPATLVTVGTLLAGSAGKKALFASLGVNGAAAVDMESAEWARVAAERETPFGVVRVVYERAEDDLPAFLSRCQGPHGGISRVKVARYAAAHPRVAPSLLSMRKRLRLASERLGEFMERLLAEIR